MPTSAPPASALGGVTVEPDKQEGEKPAAETKQVAEAPSDATPLELKLPEGVELDAQLLDGFKATAAKVGLDSAKAQTVFDNFVAFQQAQTKSVNESFAKQDAAWAAELKADPLLGGSKWDATRADIGRVAQHFKAGPALKLLESAGLGNHPELVRFVASVGRALREDSIAGTRQSGGAGERQPFGDVAYPTMKSSEKEQ